MQNEIKISQAKELLDKIVWTSPMPKHEIVYIEDPEADAFFAQARITLMAINSGNSSLAKDMLEKLKFWK